MRASLPHTLRERRRSRSDRNEREHAPAHGRDPAVERVRSAGGPIDRASYACGCGFVFVAPVSTTVACPHCHAAQAW